MYRRIMFAMLLVLMLLFPRNMTVHSFYVLGAGAWMFGYALMTTLYALLAQNALRLVVRGFYKYVLKRLIGFLAAWYVMIHPDITNARVRKLRREFLAALRARVRTLHGTHRFIAAASFVSGTILLGTLAVWVGIVRVLSLVLHPLADLCARAIVGTFVEFWWQRASSLAQRWAAARADAWRHRVRRAVRRGSKRSAQRFRTVRAARRAKRGLKRK